MLTPACALGLGVGTVCTCQSQEPPEHPQMYSLFNELGLVVQDLCASHSLEGSEEEEKEVERNMATTVKEIKALMERQDA